MLLIKNRKIAQRFILSISITHTKFKRMCNEVLLFISLYKSK